MAVAARDVAARRKHPLRVGAWRSGVGHTGTECRTLRDVIAQRHCSKPGCSTAAVATLTYDYRDSTVVVGPLATVADPNSYDLCEEHAQNLTAPLGWQVVRLATNFEPAPPSGDDLMALVDAVRAAAAHTRNRSHEAEQQSAQTPASPSTPAAASSPAEFGPFAQRGKEEATDPSSPLDPNSPWARRRAQFRLITDDQAEQGTDTDN